jgi:hypothetical protein
MNLVITFNHATAMHFMTMIHKPAAATCDRIKSFKIEAAILYLVEQTSTLQQGFQSPKFQTLQLVQFFFLVINSLT